MPNYSSDVCLLSTDLFLCILAKLVCATAIHYLRKYVYMYVYVLTAQLSWELGFGLFLARW